MVCNDGDQPDRGDFIQEHGGQLDVLSMINALNYLSNHGGARAGRSGGLLPLKLLPSHHPQPRPYKALGLVPAGGQAPPGSRRVVIPG